MNQPKPHDPWSKLTAAARTVSDDRDPSAPYGFSTRVAALAFALERRSVSLVDRFALRALSVASLVAVFSVALNYREIVALGNPAPIALAAAAHDSELFLYDENLAIVLDLAD
jgi:hypothetical protein